VHVVEPKVEQNDIAPVAADDLKTFPAASDGQNHKPPLGKAPSCQTVDQLVVLDEQHPDVLSKNVGHLCSRLFWSTEVHATDNIPRRPGIGARGMLSFHSILTRRAGWVTGRPEASAVVTRIVARTCSITSGETMFDLIRR
jgi:hypothetical protein